MLQFRVNEQILSDHILKAYQKEIELRVASKEANKDTKKEEDDRRIRGLETYNMEANPKYNELFAGDSVFVTTNRKSGRRLSEYRDKRKKYLCCLKENNLHEDENRSLSIARQRSRKECTVQKLFDCPRAQQRSRSRYRCVMRAKLQIVANGALKERTTERTGVRAR